MGEQDGQDSALIWVGEKDENFAINQRLLKIAAAFRIIFVIFGGYRMLNFRDNATHPWSSIHPFAMR